MYRFSKIFKVSHRFTYIFINVRSFKWILGGRLAGWLAGWLAGCQAGWLRNLRQPANPCASLCPRLRARARSPTRTFALRFCLRCLKIDAWRIEVRLGKHGWMLGCLKLYGFIDWSCSLTRTTLGKFGGLCVHDRVRRWCGGVFLFAPFAETA